MRNRMRFIVLGSAAGGGLPQWNCACRNCVDARNGHPDVPRRTQSSVAVSADGRSWCLLNASPDIGTQILDTPALWPDPDKGVRHSPIEAVVLTNADVDHLAGLLTLRERQPIRVFAHARTLEALAENPIFGVLSPELVERCTVRSDAPFEPLGTPDLRMRLFEVPGKVALFRETPEALAGAGTRTGDTAGVEIIAKDGATAHYIPGCAAVDEALLERLSGSRLLFFDGTLYADDEMLAQNLSSKTGARMGHMAMSGPDGSIRALEDVEIARRVFVHMNNSNPVLRAGSAEQAAVHEAGWEIAHDGMELRL